MKELTDKELQGVQLDILKVVDAWCRENQVDYALAFGTLLGAVRHGGYIPWDDDIDICMTRENYEKFIHSFNNGRTDNYEVMHHTLDRDFPYEFAKVQDKSTRLVEMTDIDHEIGVNIDVFVIDRLGNDIENAQRVYKKCGFLRRLLEAKISYFDKNKKRSLLKRILIVLIKAFSKPFSMHWITSNMNRICTQYNDIKDSKYCAIACVRDFKPSKTFTTACFDEYLEMKFEDIMAKVPKGYDEMLHKLYGDYMQLPPVEEREPHHLSHAYRR